MNAKVPMKLKGRFYQNVVRPTMLYETKCWMVKNPHENKARVVDMMMLCWMCGKTRQDKIKNKNIINSVGVAHTVKKMVENIL